MPTVYLQHSVSYVLYMQKVSEEFNSFRLQNLPPTSSAPKYPLYRTYFAFQKWPGNGGN